MQFGTLHEVYCTQKVPSIFAGASDGTRDPKGHVTQTDGAPGSGNGRIVPQIAHSD